MKVLVVSDSHGDNNSVSRIVGDNLDAKVIIHLGDGEQDMEGVHLLNNQANIIAVRGNCDMASLLPVDCVRVIKRHTFYCTHGFTQQVKQGTTELLKTAKKYNADIVLYGHTHLPVNKQECGVHLFNPGSLKNGFYGIINIDDKDVEFKHILLE